MGEDARRFDSLERVVRDTRRELGDFRSTAMARIGLAGTGGGGGGGGVSSVNGETGAVVISKSDVGLGNVADIAPAGLPVSDDTQAALDLKANAAELAEVATSGAYGDLSGTPTIPAAYTDEQVRDVVAGALVAGSNVTITPSDVGDTITIEASGGGGSVEGTNPQVAEFEDQVDAATTADTAAASDLSSKRAAAFSVDPLAGDIFTATDVSNRVDGLVSFLAANPAGSGTLAMQQYDARWAQLQAIYAKEDTAAAVTAAQSRLDAAPATVVLNGDHGTLLGKADDDHPQYLNEARGDARYLPVGGVLTAYASGDQTVTNYASLTPSPWLWVECVAGATYTLDGFLVYSATVAQDIKVAVVGPSGASARWTLLGVDSGSALTTGAGDLNTLTSTLGSTRVTAGAGAAVIMSAGLLGSVVIGGTAGIVRVQFAQNVAAASTSAILRAGSWIRLNRVS